MSTRTNPLLSDRDVAFLLYEVFDAPSLCALPAFAEHSRETFELYLDNARRLAREHLLPSYKTMDESPPLFSDGAITLHPAMARLYPKLVELGLLNASRPHAVGGAQMPLTVHSIASAYLSAGNLSALGFIGLTTGAAHLIEAFGDAWMRETFMARMYAGEWTGTMALTEPQAGSSLADVKTKATKAADGSYRIRGSKIFISGGDHGLTENIVHMTLARIEGAPAGTKGVSLFVVPKRRPEKGALVDNDVSVAGAIHKIGWRGLPSLALEYGERDDCVGWLLGEPNRGLSYMFQMMNEARIMVGMAATATASVAYHEALDYARERPQGRGIAARDPSMPQVPIVEHADVRRMLLRQKAIVEGSLSLIVLTSRYADLSEHGADEASRKRAKMLLDLLTPIAKSFPAEKGFEANALSVQVHGGYGYSSEYLPEAWMRDQKLNTLHEGTTGIQSMDLLGRKVVAEGGAALSALLEDVRETIALARGAGVEASWCDAVATSLDTLAQLTMALAQRGVSGDADFMLLHSADYLELSSIIVLSWLWLWQAAAAQTGLARGDVSRPFYEGKRCAAQYWINTELPRVAHLAALCRDGEDSYGRMKSEWF